MFKHLLLTVTLLTAPAAAQYVGDTVITLDFEGGTAAEYAKAVRKAAGGANIVVGTDVDLVRMGAVELNAVSLSGALWLLDDLQQQDERQLIELSVDEYNDGETYVFSIKARTKGQRMFETHLSSLVLSVAEPVEWGLTFEDVLSAVETAQALFDGYPKANIKFHESTGLIVARGHPDQMHNIEHVVENLLKTAQVRAMSAWNAGNEDTEPPAALSREMESIRERLDRLENEIAAMTKAMGRIEGALKDR